LGRQRKPLPRPPAPRPDPPEPLQPATTGEAMALHGRRRRRSTVKPDIHPKYYAAKVHCGSCGTEWTVGSTRPELRVDVCANCHPFFTGTQNIIDTAGQVERFQKRLERSARA
jgi:ribosomal protein L31